MYTAIITNAFNGVRKRVHDFVFQTSRYSSFEEQVNSYMLDQEENVKAMYSINLDLSDTTITKAYDTLTTTNATNDDQEVEFLDYLDRILEGIFKLPPLNPPTTTEFNIIKNENTNDVVAILIRNPEPFNDPKTPLEEIRDTIEVVSVSVGKANDTYSVLYSKDYSQALIMHTSKKITADSLVIRFKYKLWNGSEYVIKDKISIEITLAI